MFRVRLWVVGATFLACGVISRILLEGRKNPESLAGFVALQLGVGLFLLAIPVARKAYTRGDPTRGEVLGVVSWCLGALVSCVLVFSAMGTR
jgi:hypothetical protein